MDLDPIQLLIIGAIGVMIFGGNLPEVTKKIGKSLADFKRGWDNVRNEFHSALDLTGAMKQTTTSTSTSVRRHGLDDLDDMAESTAPKFEPPPRPIRPTPP